MRFHNRFKDYLRTSVIGILLGILMQLLDRLPQQSLWCFPSVAVMYGFWIIAVSVLIWRSTSHIAAGLHSFLLLFFTALSFYGFLYVLGLIIPRFSGTAFQTNAFLSQAAIAFGCGIAAIILYCWNHKNWYNAILFAVPIGILAAETLSVLNLLQNQQTHLFQLLLNAGFCLYLGLQFRKSAKNKELYTVSVIAIAWLFNRYIF